MSNRNCDVVGPIVTKYLEKYSDLPSRTIARLILEDPNNRKVFCSVDQARSAVRRLRGSGGASNRKNLTDRRFVGTTPRIPGIPRSDAQPWEPYTVPSNIACLGLLCDVHIPYHSERAVERGLLKLAENRDIQALLLNGDINDGYQLSHFEKDPRARNLAGELEMTNQFLDLLEDVFPGIPTIYKEANHERRFKKYVAQFAPQLLEIPGAKFESLIHAEERRITFVDNQRIIYFHGLPILHGDEQRSASMVYPARAAYLKLGTPVLISHVHRTSEYPHVSPTGRVLRSYSVGCLCDLHPEYARLNQWDHAVAKLYATDAGVDVRLIHL